MYSFNFGKGLLMLKQITNLYGLKEQKEEKGEGRLHVFFS